MKRKKLEGGEPAFPQPRPDIASPIIPGMTLRDWFAGQALIGILGSRNGFLVDVGTKNAPNWAYDTADAMLAKRAEASE